MYFATAIAHYWRIIDVRFYESVVEDILLSMLMICCSWERRNSFLTCFCIIMCSILACHRNLLSTARPSRRCSVTFSIFWQSNDGLNDKSEIWCLCRVVITFDFALIGLMSMWLALHHTEIRSRQSCSVFWIYTLIFPVAWSVVSIHEHMIFCRIWWSMQR